MGTFLIGIKNGKDDTLGDIMFVFLIEAVLSWVSKLTELFTYHTCSLLLIIYISIFNNYCVMVVTTLRAHDMVLVIFGQPST